MKKIKRVLRIFNIIFWKFYKANEEYQKWKIESGYYKYSEDFNCKIDF